MHVSVNNMATTERLHVNLCEAKSSDYEAVMAIDKGIYDGFDYLPHMYHYYLQDPNRICYVLKVNGRIVSYHFEVVFALIQA